MPFGWWCRVTTMRGFSLFVGMVWALAYRTLVQAFSGSSLLIKTRRYPSSSRREISRKPIRS